MEREESKKLEQDISKSLIEHGPTVKAATKILAIGIESRASDIFIEPDPDAVKVRYRVDGILYERITLPVSFHAGLVSRVKVMAGLDIAEHRLPQEGRFRMHFQARDVDFRVSIVPTSIGEKIVMRILDKSRIILDIDKLGFDERTLTLFKRNLVKPFGMLLVCGPTGSGKTTTLYSALNFINSVETNIVTVEDPIEYELSGINQVSVQDEIGLTFAQALRSILRQDPDIILVGEIRDTETADIAVKAALTGHLVLSTIHTNRASGTIPRLLSMGVKPFLLAPALNAMIGQRLVRRICRECKHEDKLDNETAKHVKEILEKLPSGEIKKLDLTKLKFFKSDGCEVCQGIGYKGRIGIFETLIMNKDIEKLILSANLSEYDIEGIAVKKGMVTMLQDGLLKALDGITSIEEVFRVAAEKE